MANNPNDDKNFGKEELVSNYSSSSLSASSENADYTNPPTITLDPTPTLKGDDDQGGSTSGGGAVEAIIAPSSGEKKRGYADPGGSSSGGVKGEGEAYQKKARKKGDLINPPQGVPTCYVCDKVFQSWRALFGHMSVHRIREGRRRGAFPPPVFTPPSGASPERDVGDVPKEVLREQLVSALVNSAQAMLDADASSRPDGLDLDLNQPGPDPDQEEGRFDLNKAPPPEEKKDEGDGAAK